ncbi:MAG: hypothetical protein LBD91_01790 [Prevotellaceae bacterium]|nr:hypothetical protein [Prevotellaceae bacterium]
MTTSNRERMGLGADMLQGYGLIRQNPASFNSSSRQPYTIEGNFNIFF